MADTLDIVNESNDLEFELDNLIISGTIDLEDYYTKEQTDSLLQENYYNKQEVDDKLSDISSGESYTQGSGINISDDNVISIDDTVALKTDLNDYQEKFDYIIFASYNISNNNMTNRISIKGVKGIPCVVFMIVTKNSIGRIL